MTTKTRFDRFALTLSATILASCGARAVELPLTFLGTNAPPIDFHGFLSQGLLASTDYNYLDSHSKDGSLQFFEAGINASINPFPRTRITAQGFAFDVGHAGRYEPFLDYASIEYTFTDWLGVRGGRFRKPGGIYNHIQDVDLARTWVLLPQGIYDARFRDLSCSLDGGEVFGSVSLNKAGSLSYEAYSGFTHTKADSGLGRLISNSLGGGRVTSFDDIFEAGAQIWWNTPVNGLRFGASLDNVLTFNYNFDVPTGFPPPFDTASLHAEDGILLQQYSAEYVWKNWTFQAEFYDIQVSQDTISPLGVSHSFSSDYAWYGGAAYRFNKWLEVGGYYTEYHLNGAVPPGGASSDKAQKDAALSVRFDPTDWWIFKVEGHYIRGTALLYDNAANPVRNDNGWWMLAAKTTFSF